MILCDEKNFNEANAALSRVCLICVTSRRTNAVIAAASDTLQAIY